MQMVTVECQRCEGVFKQEFDGVLIIGLEPGEGQAQARYINHELEPGFAITRILESLNPAEYNEAMSTIGLYLADKRMRQGNYD